MKETRRLGRATIAIYNSYDPNNFREAHRRILARAGPLALAFDFNLVTIGFPFPQDLNTPQEIAEWVSTTTSIGEDGSYLKDVTAKGRFSTVAYPGKGFQPQLGEVVLTTCNPDKKKKRSVDEVVDIHDMAPNHMDITFGEYSMETCTALGACVAVLAHKVHDRTR